MAAPFDYVMIEVGSLDNPGVRIKGVWISEDPLYLNSHTVLVQISSY